MSPTRTEALCLTAAANETAQSVWGGTAKLERMAAETFEAFRLGKGGAMLFDNAKPTFEQCRDLCAAGTAHKAQFVVRRTNALNGEIVLTLFQVRAKAPAWKLVDHVPTRVSEHYADQIAVIQLVEPTYPNEIARRVGLTVADFDVVARERAGDGGEGL